MLTFDHLNLLEGLLVDFLPEALIVGKIVNDICVRRSAGSSRQVPVGGGLAHLGVCRQAIVLSCLVSRVVSIGRLSGFRKERC